MIFTISDAEIDGAKAFQGVHMTIVFPCPTSQHTAMTLYLHVFDAGRLNYTFVCTVMSCTEYE